MKLINKFLCFLSVLVLFVPLLCFNVSAQSASLVESDIVCNYSKLSSMESKYKRSPYVRVADLYNHKVNNGEDIPFHFFDTSDPLGCLNAFTNSFGAYYSGFSDLTFDIGKNSDFYYVLYHGTSVQGSYGSGYGSVLIASSSPFHLVDGKYVSDSGDNIYILFLNYQSCSNDVYNFDSYNLSKYTFKYDSEHDTALKPYFSFQNHGSAYTTFVYSFSSVYSNIDDLSFPDGYEFSKVPGTESLSEQIDVSLTPEFGLDMDILNSSDDRFKFSVTNNTDKPIQFCVYIDEPGNDNSYLGDYVVNPAYTNALWNYKIDSYYYDIDITDNSKYLGFVVDNLISPVKCHGTIVWVYLDSGLTYSDYVYWKNVSLATGKYYNINFLACYVPDNLDIVSNIFDVELLSDPIILSDFNSELRNDHWWTIDFLSKVVISDKMNSYKLSYKDVSTIYQANFSLVSIPDYSSVSVGGNGIVSNGYKNDLSEFHDRDYTYNLDTGKESFISSGAFSNDFDMDNVSVDNVKSYITYCTDFFSLIKGTLSTFPNFIWVLIFFGLSAFVVVAIVKWIIS